MLWRQLWLEGDVLHLHWVGLGHAIHSWTRHHGHGTTWVSTRWAAMIKHLWMLLLLHVLLHPNRGVAHAWCAASDGHVWGVASGCGG